MERNGVDMARTIVVALDGSPVAEEAVPVAAHLAGDRDGVLLLLRVVDQRQ